MPRPRTFDEDDVVAAARDAFWRGGYTGTSLEELTTATGLGKGSLYGAFGDKHALFLRALDEYCETATAATREQLRGPVDGAYQRLVAYIRALVASNVADTARLGCLMAKSAAELAGSDAEVRDKVAAALTGMHTELAHTIGDAQREGTISSAADPDQLASLLLTVLRGMEALHKSGVEDRIVTGAVDQMLRLLPQGE
jgi:TetR/AcrR family transcriptional regulator, transcriptional repressor for nem operon